MAAHLVAVTTPDDPRIDAYVRLRDRDLSRASGRADGLFVAEGEVVVRVLVSSA